MFEVGDIVRMKTGGRRMIVMKIVPPNRVEVAWMKKSNINLLVMDQSTLEPDVGKGTIRKLLEKMMITLDEILSKVQEETTVEKSMVTLLEGISQRLKDAGMDQAKLTELAAMIDNNKEGMLAAINANTPSAPPVPTPDPTPVPTPDPVPTPAPADSPL